jgi:hypothetical protein
MNNINAEGQDTVIIVPKKKKKPKRNVAYQTILNCRLKRYDEELVRKLPNEFRSSFMGYNHRSISDSPWHFDENNYNHF